MAVSTVLTITHDKEVQQDVTDLLVLPTDQRVRFVSNVCDLIRSLGGGSRNGSLDIQVNGGDAVAASGTIVFGGVGAANDTVLVNGVTFTAVASGAAGNQWNVGASATASAANLAAAIAASATALVNLVTASAASGTVTITAVAKGTTGNAITIAKGTDSLTAMTVSGARLTSGANASAHSFAFGV